MARTLRRARQFQRLTAEHRSTHWHLFIAGAHVGDPRPLATGMWGAPWFLVLFAAVDGARLGAGSSPCPSRH
eukprot:9656780-Alexandrium_andersonii.AAC.1